MDSKKRRGSRRALDAAGRVLEAYEDHENKPFEPGYEPPEPEYGPPGPVPPPRHKIPSKIKSSLPREAYSPLTPTRALESLLDSIIHGYSYQVSRI